MIAPPEVPEIMRMSSTMVRRVRHLVDDRLVEAAEHAIGEGQTPARHRRRRRVRRRAIRHRPGSGNVAGRGRADLGGEDC